ncbi:ABC transporter ATP-binding protein, partial [Nocardiopsis sp. LSu2-4]|nr:ABC transporter ATP-binding protein [Nocardiopsis suaedae]
LREGRLQQVDTPKNLFNNPVNLFVAGFIGSPAMNFVMAELQRDGDGGVLKFADHTINVPAGVVASRDGLKDYFGRQLILGIRPSDFDDAAHAPHEGADMRVTADVTEELGTEINVIFSVDAPPVQHEEAAALAADASGDGDEESSSAALPLAGDKSVFTARVNPRSDVRPGQPLTLSVDVTQLHFFDKDSGLALGHPENR